MNTTRILGIIVALLVSAGCAQRDASEKESAMAVVPEAGIEALSGKKILFAHMSVGKDILAGLEEWQGADARLRRLKVFEYATGMEIAGPGIYHFMLGNNSFPERKVDVCEQTLATSGAGGRFDILVFKFCYVDFKDGTGVESAFAAYRDFVARTKERFPGLKIVHVTVPLTTRYKGIKGWLKYILSGDHPNRARSNFNMLLVKEFGASDAIFDLARVESTDAKGNVRTFGQKGQRTPYLLNEYTDDGGHLNSLGRARASREFIRVLAGY